MEILLKHINQPGRDPREVKPDISDELRDLLIKAIDRDPKARFQTAAEFREALQALPEAGEGA
jgi:serine/threonine protein kinase